MTTPTLEYEGPRPKPARAARPWRVRRGFYYAGHVLLFTAVAFYFGPNWIMFDQLTRLGAADFVAETRRFVPVVRAVKAFQRDHGRLPYGEFKELVPQYLATDEIPGDVEKNGTVYFFARDNHAVTYDLTPGREGWRVSGPFASGPIPAPLVTLRPTSQPARGH